MADPQRLGKYEIQSVLGKGAMGVVYKAFDPHIERLVAIKTICMDRLDPDLAAQYVARFRNEAKAAGRLQHPNIVGVYEYGEDDSVAYIAMEYVEGTGLREYLNRWASFDFGLLVSLLSQLLQALEFAHERGVVHRDIKPSNLIVTERGLLKVADFGVARVDTSNLTGAGVAIGTPSYMSPEQCMGEEVDARSDLFSVGVVLYELVAGEKPFRGSVEGIAYKICREDPVPPSKVSPLTLPEALDQLVAKALAKQPDARFPTARAFNDALHAIAAMSLEIGEGEGNTVVSMGSVTLRPPLPALDDTTLTTAERTLARFIGPLAKLIVRKAAARAHDRAELCSLLSESIDDPGIRSRFVEAFAKSANLTQSGGSSLPGTGSRLGTNHRSSPGDPSAGAPTGISSGTTLDSTFVDEVSARLAVYLGPIARIVAKNAAQKTKDRTEFVALVADNLGTQDRAAFLVEMKRYGER
jgi:serine/threonine-protein kinase